MDFKKFKIKVETLSRRLSIPTQELMQWKFVNVLQAMKLIDLI